MQAVKLGTPFALSAQRVFYQSPWNAFYPHLAVDNDRTVHLVFSNNDGAANRFYYASKPVTGTWPISPMALFTDAAVGTLTAPDDRGGLYLVWNRYSTGTILFCRSLAGNSTCSSPESLTAPNMSAEVSQLIRDDWGGLRLVERTKRLPQAHMLIDHLEAYGNPCSYGPSSRHVT